MTPPGGPLDSNRIEGANAVPLTAGPPSSPKPRNRTFECRSSVRRTTDQTLLARRLTHEAIQSILGVGDIPR